MLTKKDVMGVIAETSYRTFLWNSIIGKASANKDEDIVDDVVHDSLIKIILDLQKGATDFKTWGMFYSWSALVVLNTYIDVLRKKTRDRKKFVPGEALRKEDSFNMADKNDITGEFPDEDVAVLDNAIKELSVEQQEVIEYITEKGYRFKDIAEETGISMGTLLGRMRYARISLRKKLNIE